MLSGWIDIPLLKPGNEITYCSSFTKSSKLIQAEIVNESVVNPFKNLFGIISNCVSPSNFKHDIFSFLIESVILNLSISYSLSILG